MSLIVDFKRLISRKLKNFSFIDTALFVLGVGIVIWGIWQNELAWIPTGFLLIEKVRPKNKISDN